MKIYSETKPYKPSTLFVSKKVNLHPAALIEVLQHQSSCDGGNTSLALTSCRYGRMA
jgi:hypothetical protein